MSIRLCPATDVPLSEVRRVELADGREIALYHLDDGFFATDDLCSHGEAFLSDGEIEDDQIICPYHMGAFDIRTGEATMAPCHIAIRSYRIVEDGGELFIEAADVSST